ncbi:hypothetical protein D4764_14G0005670 [Takifugu flavidus]|uniref:G-protein coupled receptors family 1 profile domain-containing protein n=1 Tax=Takifugu flavidus TaxID=433684 RepID=A0A5C6P454_9TELE|nr:hypothetical protein D4764_14G0005670 [Takifugu flavidus]
MALIAYLLTLLANGVVAGVILIDKSLHRPMFIMICHLVVCDLLGATAMLPRLTVHFLTWHKGIPYAVAIIQSSLADFICHLVEVSTPTCGHELLVGLIFCIDSVLELPTLNGSMTALLTREGWSRLRLPHPRRHRGQFLRWLEPYHRSTMFLFRIGILPLTYPSDRAKIMFVVISCVGEQCCGPRRFWGTGHPLPPAI